MSETIPERTLAVFAGDDQNKKLIAQLRADENVKLIEFPFFTPEPVEPLAQSDLSAIMPANFDWLIFPDVYAVEFFLRRLAEKQYDFFVLDDLRVCALGEAVADQLRFVQLHADIIPARVDAASVFSAFGDYLSAEEVSGFENLWILLPKEIAYVSELSEMLRREKSSLTELPVYRLQTENAAGLSRLGALLKGGAIDEFVFSSPAEVTVLVNLYRRDLIELLAETSVSATNEITFQTLREHGLRPLYYKKIETGHCSRSQIQRK